MMKWTWTTLADQLRINNRLKLRLKHSHHNNKRLLLCPNNQDPRMMKKVKMIKKFPELTTQQSTPTCRCLRMSKTCSSIFRGTSHRSLTSILNWSHSFPIMCQQLEKWMLASKCLSQMELRRILVSLSLMSQHSTARIRQCSSSSMCRARMSLEQPRLMWTL